MPEEERAAGAPAAAPLEEGHAHPMWVHLLLAPKKEVSPPPPSKKKMWWKIELEVQAAICGPMTPKTLEANC
jgi:hypothetical protein